MKTLFTLLAFFATFTFVAQDIDIELFADGFTSAVNLQNAGDDRLFVVEQSGIIKILNPDGSTNPDPFIDLSSSVSCCGERGLLGLAFHPDYQNNGYFFVDYTDTSGNTVIDRYSVDSGNPDLADPNTKLPILSINQPFSNHNGGCLAFGPDGYLYIATGDGGSGGDPGNRAQNTELLLGKILRIDIASATGAYDIPTDNPFFNDPPNAPEIWSYGVRNPWKFSFDFTDNNIWIADVGQGEIEEVNKQPASTAGINYGWRCYEGSEPYNTGGCPPMGDLTFPIAEYDHSVGQSITGGYVYRGSEYPGIQGYYIFADYVSGRFFSIDPSGNFEDLGNFGGNWSSFGEGNDKTLYAVKISGSIYKVVDNNLGTDQVDAPIISAHPNPASDQVFVSASHTKIESLQLFDINGRLLFAEEQMNLSTAQFSVSKFKSGIYFLKVKDTSGNISTKRLIIN